MSDSEIKVSERDITDLTARPQSGGLLDSSTESEEKR